MSQYEYAKDNRTDKKYKRNFDGGTYNQEPAIAQLVIDRYLQDGTVIQYKHNPDKTFQNEQGFWSQMKRSIDGTYHCVSPKHLQLYVDEFVYRYNLRNAPVFPALIALACLPVAGIGENRV